MRPAMMDEARCGCQGSAARLMVDMGGRLRLNIRMVAGRKV